MVDGLKKVEAEGHQQRRQDDGHERGEKAGQRRAEAGRQRGYRGHPVLFHDEEQGDDQKSEQSRHFAQRLHKAVVRRRKMGAFHRKVRVEECPPLIAERRTQRQEEQEKVHARVRALRWFRRKHGCILKGWCGKRKYLEKAASFSMPASPKDSPNAYGPWRAVRRFVPLFFQPLVLLESRAVTSRQTADPAGCTGRPFQWEGKAGFIRQVPCYNQSPEQCRPFFFVPCAFFNSGYAHVPLLGFPERFIPPSAGKVLVGPARAHPESVWSPHGKALGAGGASRLGSLGGEGPF